MPVADERKRRAPPQAPRARPVTRGWRLLSSARAPGGASIRGRAPASRSDQLADLVPRATALIAAWEARFGPYEPHAAGARGGPPGWLPRGTPSGSGWPTTIPFFHPRYAGPDAQAAAPRGGRRLPGGDARQPEQPRARRRRRGRARWRSRWSTQLRVMFGLPAAGLGHLTSSGTIANLEALWVARELHPGKRVVHSAAAHYTHARMCEVLGITGTAVAPDARGRIDLDAVEAECATRRRRDRRAHDRHDRRSAPSIASTRRSPCASATACACTSTAPTAASSRCSPAARTRSSRPALRGDRAVRLGRRRPPQARPAALRLRRGPLRRPGGRSASTATTRRTRTSPRPSCTSARSASSARARARRPPALWLTLQALPLERDEGLGRGARGRARARRSTGRARLRASEVLDAAPRARARHRHLPAAGRLAVGARRRQRRRAEGRHGGPRRPGLPQHPVPRARRAGRAPPRARGRRRRRARPAQRAHEARARARGAAGCTSASRT